MKKTLIIFLLAVAGVCRATATVNADIDFSNGIENGIVAGTKNSMALSNTTGSQPFELGFNNGTETVMGDVLRVGKGTGTVTIADEELAGGTDEVVVTFDMYFGLLKPSKYSGFFLYDTQGTLIGGLYLGWDSNSNPQPSVNTFGFEADYDHISYRGGTATTNNAGSCTEDNRTTFELHLNYATCKMYAVQKTAGTVKQTTAAVDMPTTNPLKTFTVQSDYNDSNRRSWFDNLLITTTSAIDATAATVTATIGEEGWATLYTDKALDFSQVEGLTAYTATLSDNTVTLAQVTEIGSEAGVVLKGKAGDYKIPFLATEPNTAKGSLTGSATDATAYDAYDGQTLYILTATTGGNVQFNPCNGGTIAAGKAFLTVDGQGDAAKAMQVMLAGETTGISNVNVSVPVPVKRIQSGQLVIEKNGKTYNAAGQQK